MNELVTFFTQTSISVIVLVVVAYFVRSYIEGSFKSRFTNIESLVKSSLSIKESLRDREQTELVEFRVAVERWEYFLQTGVGDVTMKSESADFEPAEFHKRDVELFGGELLIQLRGGGLLEILGGVPGKGAWTGEARQDDGRGEGTEGHNVSLATGRDPRGVGTWLL